MPRRRSKKNIKPLQELNNQPTVALETSSKTHFKLGETGCEPTIIPEILGIRSLLDDENHQPSTSSSLADNISSNAAALYDELDSFRQRWKRELEVSTKTTPQLENLDSKDDTSIQPIDIKTIVENTEKRDDSKEDDHVLSQSSLPYSSEEGYLDHGHLYVKAKKLFLTAVELEQDEMHHESIRYYKQAMHLCPDIEKLIFREQCAASAKINAAEEDGAGQKDSSTLDCQIKSNVDNNQELDRLPLFNRICQCYHDENKGEAYLHCKPTHKQKSSSVHISELPHELILQIFRYVIGRDLDLASLEGLGLVCRGFYLLSKDPSLWRSICYATWGELVAQLQQCEDSKAQINWFQMFLDKPRVNYDGVYISRTRYIRQGDTGFQDLTYRPFHVIRYYRYIRFFPDKRVLILTTNEEPDRIIPIFRHATYAKHFSPDLSILDGTFEFVTANHICITAEKDCLDARILYPSRRRQAHLQWSRQSPISQKFNLKFELKTAESKPYRNNVLKWLEYTILSRMEMGQEITSFDLTQDTFPNLIFARVKRLSLKLTGPLSSH